MSHRPLTRWLFGKLPAQGDFVSRGLDYGLRDALDAWLTAQVADARGRSPDFEERYDAAPAWHFVDRDPDGAWSGGALCASLDAAGRRFPVMLAAPANDAAHAAQQAGACLEALYGAFGGGWDADALHAAPLAAGEAPWAPEGPEWVLIGEDGPGAVLPGRFPTRVIATMLEMAA